MRPPHQPLRRRMSKRLFSLIERTRRHPDTVAAHKPRSRRDRIAREHTEAMYRTARQDQLRQPSATAPVTMVWHRRVPPSVEHPTCGAHKRLREDSRRRKSNRCAEQRLVAGAWGGARDVVTQGRDARPRRSRVWVGGKNSKREQAQSTEEQSPDAKDRHERLRAKRKCCAYPCIGDFLTSLLLLDVLPT